VCEARKDSGDCCTSVAVAPFEVPRQTSNGADEASASADFRGTHPLALQSLSAPAALPSATGSAGRARTGQPSWLTVEAACAGLPYSAPAFSSGWPVRRASASARRT